MNEGLGAEEWHPDRELPGFTSLNSPPGKARFTASSSSNTSVNDASSFQWSTADFSLLRDASFSPPSSMKPGIEARYASEQLKSLSRQSPFSDSVAAPASLLTPIESQAQPSVDSVIGISPPHKSHECELGEPKVIIGDNGGESLMIPQPRHRNSEPGEDQEPPSKRISLGLPDPTLETPKNDMDLGTNVKNRDLVRQNFESAIPRLISPTPSSHREDVQMANTSANHEQSLRRGSRMRTPPETPAPVTNGEFNVECSSLDDDDENDGQYVPSGDESEDLFVPDSPTPRARKFHSISRPGAKHHKKLGPRARTAQEWHKNRLRKQKPSQRRDIAWKLKEMAAIKANGPEANGKNKSSKSSQRKAKALFNPRTLFEGEVESGDADSMEMIDQMTGTTTKKGFFPAFAEQHRHLNVSDMHRCKTDWNDLYKKSISFGLGRVKKVEEYQMVKWKVEGMNYGLRNHQLIGTSHIVERECSDEAPFGMICADDMGMGKTVQAIAAILLNPAGPEDIKQECKTTLIVVPPSIKNQWWDEICWHAPALGENIIIYQESDKTNSLKKFRNADIVLTTYYELWNSHPNAPKDLIELWMKDKNANLYEELVAWSREHGQEPRKGEDKSEGRGLLHQMNWYRVILDEGHIIKNYLSRTSRAAVALRAQNRLILSGTPIMNSFEEFWPLLKFLREPITAELTIEEFRERFCGETADGIRSRRLEILLSEIIIRRTAKDKLMGQPIVPLPADHRSTRQLSQSPAELILTQCIEHKLRVLRNVPMAKTDPRRPLKHKFCQFTRLRQLAGNPDSIAPQIQAMFTIDELREIRRRIKAFKIPRKPKSFPNMLYDRIGIWIKEKEAKVYDGKGGDEFDDANAICLLCDDVSETLQMIKKCKHTFCQSCLDDNILRDMGEDGDNVKEQYLCPKCQQPYKSTVDYFESKRSGSKGAKNSSKQRFGLDARNFRPRPGPKQLCFERWLQSLDNGDLTPLPSTKLVSLVNEIEKWLDEARDDNIVVFSQFQHFQTMIGCMLQEKNISFLYYSGDMTQQQRDKAVKMLQNDRKIKVMLCGLKVGGLGLNLTMANRVSETEIWWNPYVDTQAFGRVHRMGQDKETYFDKMVLGDSVDSRLIMFLQSKKEKAIGGIMQDDENTEEADDILGGRPNQTWAQKLQEIDHMIEMDPHANQADDDNIGYDASQV